MKKELISELNRISNLMGTKPLIVEAKNPFYSILERGLEKLGMTGEKGIEKQVTKSVNDFKGKLTPELTQEVNRIITKGLDKTTSEEFEALYSLPGMKRAIIETIASVAPAKLESLAKNYAESFGPEVMKTINLAYKKGGVPKVKQVLIKTKVYDEEAELLWNNWRPKNVEVQTEFKPNKIEIVKPINLNKLNNIIELPTEQEIIASAKSLVPNATEKELANIAIQVKKLAGKNIETITQEEFNKMFNTQISALQSDVRSRIIKEANKISVMTKWKALPKLAKTAIWVATAAGAGGLGLWGVVSDIIFGGVKKGAEDVGKKYEKHFGDEKTNGAEQQQDDATPVSGSGVTKPGSGN